MMKGRVECVSRKMNSANAFGRRRRIAVMAIVICLLGALTIGGTLAYLTTKTGSVENTFKPGNVSCEVRESFKDNVKTDINIKNTGNTDAYIRVKLVSYRVNDDGNRIGGNAGIPSFSLGEDWKKHTDGYYYYCKPVAPNENTANLNTSEIRLSAYNDADGGRQVIEVLAEAIQSDPTSAVQNAWDYIPSAEN